jgi:multimeric flavodoxin WrbA
MKLLALNGSPRSGGNTAKALELLREALEQRAQTAGEELRWEGMELSGLDIRPCRGCRLCFDRGEAACPQDDRLPELHRAIREADCVILASPVYVNDVSALLKRLMERLAFVCHRPAYFTTPFFLLATTGGTPARHCLRSMQAAVLSWGGQLIGTQQIVAGACIAHRELRERYGSSLSRAAAKITAFVSRRKIERPGFVSLLVFHLQRRAWRRIFRQEGIDSVDGRYWTEQGFLDRGRSYYTAHRAPLLRVAAARAAATVLGRIFA